MEALHQIRSAFKGEVWHMGPYGIGIILGIAGGLAAKYIYRAVDTHWPESYVYTRSLFERFQRTTFLRYVLFRTLPLFAAFLAANVTAANLKASIIASAISGCLIFIATTDALAAYTALKYQDTRRRIMGVRQGVLAEPGRSAFCHSCDYDDRGS